jgi:hypothetical protein
MKSLAKFALLGCLYAPFAWSQCSGINVGGACVPPPCTPGSPLACNQQQPQQSQQQPVPQPRPVWADRWGAIAIDLQTGQAGTVEGKVSAAKANQAAMDYCTMHGSEHCQVILSFHNQCAAVAMGPKMGVAGGPTQEAAERSAISQCNSESACKIVYSKCSYAERVR